MQSNPQTGNRVVLLLAAFVMVLCALFVDWGTSTLSADDMMRESAHHVRTKGGLPGSEKLAVTLSGAFARSVLIPVSAANSAVYLGPVRFPYWAGCVFSGFALIVLTLNTIGFSAVSKVYVLVLLAAGTFVAMWALVNMLANGALGSGAVLLLLASIIGTCATIQPPRSKLNPQPDSLS